MVDFQGNSHAREAFPLSNPTVRVCGCGMLECKHLQLFKYSYCPLTTLATRHSLLWAQEDAHRAAKARLLGGRTMPVPTAISRLGEWAFCKALRRPSRRMVGSAFAKAVKSADLVDVRPHDLRRAFLTRAPNPASALPSRPHRRAAGRCPVSFHVAFRRNPPSILAAAPGNRDAARFSSAVLRSLRSLRTAREHRATPPRFLYATRTPAA